MTNAGLMDSSCKIPGGGMYDGRRPGAFCPGPDGSQDAQARKPLQVRIFWQCVLVKNSFAIQNSRNSSAAMGR